MTAILPLTTPIHSASAQQLALSASVGKEVFFEGEPIYAVFQLSNAGPDTAWTWMFEFAADRLNLTLQRSDGSRVPSRYMWIDYVWSPGWRGVPLAPGGRQYMLVVLQNIVGDPVVPSWTLFPWKIGVGSYSLAATFHPAVPGGPTAVPDVVATPLRIEVRARTPEEDRSFSEVERLLSEGWDRETRAGTSPDS